MLSESAPFLITAALAFLGALPGLFLPETADLKMPDTLEVSRNWRRMGHVTHSSPLIGCQDIAEFGRHDRLLWMPLCRGRRRFRRGVMGVVRPHLGVAEVTLPSTERDNPGFDM